MLGLIGVVYATYFLGGVAIALGPGQLILAALPKPGADARAAASVAYGCLGSLTVS
jgi:hypothetical protein